MKALIINTYAGSLLIAAQQERLEILGSYEDAGYGSKLQRDNFPDVRIVERRQDWPEDVDFSDAIVLAHPPCAAFSQMSTSVPPGQFGKNMGVDAKKFQCTVDVLRYALGKNPLALAIESVVPALEGARTVHDEAAAKYGYHVYRILQNAVSFGTGQWRPRFWAVFTRASAMTWWHVPVVLTAGEVLAGTEGGRPFAPAIKQFEKAVRQLREHEFTGEQVAGILSGKAGFGQLHAAVWRYLEKPCKSGEVREKIKRPIFGKVFEHCLPNVINPDEFSSVIIRGVCFTLRGVPITVEGYKALMGFPLDYRVDRQPNLLREWLSRGVCPPVARWVIQTLRYNLSKIHVAKFCTSPGAYTLAPGEVADFRPNRKSFR